MKIKKEEEREMPPVAEIEATIRGFDYDDNSEIMQYFYKRDIELSKEYDYGSLTDESL